MIRKVLWLLLLATLLAGCDAGNKRRLELLDLAIVRYAQALRWGRYDDAQQYHMTREGERLRIDPQTLKHIRIAGYTIQEKNMLDDLQEADVTGVIEYYHDTEGTLRQAPMQQRWWYSEESRRWFVLGGLPEFK